MSVCVCVGGGFQRFAGLKGNIEGKRKIWAPAIVDLKPRHADEVFNQGDGFSNPWGSEREPKTKNQRRRPKSGPARPRGSRRQRPQKSPGRLRT